MICTEIHDLGYGNNLINMALLNVTKMTIAHANTTDSPNITFPTATTATIGDDGILTALNDLLNQLDTDCSQFESPTTKCVNFFLGQGVGVFNTENGWSGNLNSYSPTKGYWLNVNHGCTLTLEGECAFDPYLTNDDNTAVYDDTIAHLFNWSEQYCEDLGLGGSGVSDFPSIYIQGGNVKTYVGITLPPLDEGIEYNFGTIMNNSFFTVDALMDYGYDSLDAALEAEPDLTPMMICDMEGLSGEGFPCWETDTYITAAWWDYEEGLFAEGSNGFLSDFYMEGEEYDTGWEYSFEILRSGRGLMIESGQPGWLKWKLPAEYAVWE
jgi:hypothetical protein